MKPRDRGQRTPTEQPLEGDRELFERAVGPVRRLGGPAAVVRRRQRRHTNGDAEPTPTPPDSSPQAEQLLLRPLRRGRLRVDARLDLHGLDRRAAAEQLLASLSETRARGQRLLLVICGRGNNSSGEPRLRPWLYGWLRRHADGAGVLAWSPALPQHGGQGALYLRLRPATRARGPA